METFIAVVLSLLGLLAGAGAAAALIAASCRRFVQRQSHEVADKLGELQQLVDRIEARIKEVDAELQSLLPLSLNDLLKHLLKRTGGEVTTP